MCSALITSGPHGISSIKTEKLIYFVRRSIRSNSFMKFFFFFSSIFQLSHFKRKQTWFYLKCHDSVTYSVSQNESVLKIIQPSRRMVSSAAVCFRTTVLLWVERLSCRSVMRSGRPWNILWKPFFPTKNFWIKASPESGLT